MKEKNRIVYPVSIFILSLSLRIAYLAVLFSDPVMRSLRGHDSVFYLERAAAIAGGNWLGEGPLFYSGTLYPYMLALIGSSVPIMVTIQLVIDSFNSVLIYLLAGSLARPVAGVVSGILHATSAVFIFAAGTVLFDPWMTFLVLLGLFLVHQAFQYQSLPYWFGAGITLGMASTAKPFLLLYGPLVLMCWLVPLFRPSRRHLLYAIAGLMLGITVVLSPIVYRNLKITGDPSPFPTGGGFSFYLGNNPMADGTLVIPSHLGIKNTSEGIISSIISYASKRSGRDLSAADASSFWFREGLKFWITSPERALLLTGRKIAMLVNHAEVSDNYDFNSFREHFRILRWLPDASVIFPLGLLGILIAAFHWRKTGFILIMVCIYSVFLPLFCITSRYRYPLVALFEIFAGYAAVVLLDELRENNFHRVGAMLAGLAALSVLCLWPVTINTSAANIQLQLAEAYLSNGDRDSALWVVDKALQKNENALLYLLKAKILSGRGREEEALASLRRSVDLSPGLAEAHAMIEQISRALNDPRERVLLRETELNPKEVRSLIRLAQYYMEQKRYNEAINTLEHAIQLTPQSDEAMFYLAVAYSLRGNATKSIALYERLSVTNPDNTIVAVNLGFAYFDDGQLEKAEQNFNRAIALSPDNNLAHYGLGLVYKFSGAFEKSRRQFSLFLNSEPPQSYWARQARKNLSELEHYR